MAAAVTGTSTKSSPDVDHARRRRMAQSYILIWIGVGIDETNIDCQDTLAQLRTVVNSVHFFTQSDDAVDFLTDSEEIKAFLVIENTLGQQIIPLIHDIPQLDIVYILCDNQSQHEPWTNRWKKIKGLHTNRKTISEALQLSVKQCNQDPIALSFVKVTETTSTANLDQLAPTFMYTQVFKEILLEIEHTEQSVKEFTAYCRQNNCGTPINIDRFEKEYAPQSAIWWYTSQSFIYSELNYALRVMEVGSIIKMGFFICDLHRQIEQLYRQQLSDYHENSFIVYRGQGLSKVNFEKLLETEGGLMSFNNFLSTSTNKDVSFTFADSISTITNMVGILFVISIDSRISSAPFASIKKFSSFEAEEEILFSMHTVFRIGIIKQMTDNSQLYEVELQLTADDDKQLRVLTNQIAKEAAGNTGWQRLGNLLLKIGHSDKAEELYNLLLEQTFDESEKALYYHQLGYVKTDQRDQKMAIWYYEKALDICEKILPSNHVTLATSYNNVGAVYDHLGEYSKALSYHEKALNIYEKILPPNYPSLASSYNNIGLVYDNMREYSKALSYYEKALDTYEKTLPSNHPDLATSYNNIGSVYMSMGEYSKTLPYYEKALDIFQKCLPPNHPSLAASYNNIGTVYNAKKEYSKALSYYEKALGINEKILPPNHPDLVNYYHNIGLVYDNMREYSKTLPYYEKALNIYEKTLPPNHPDLAISYNSIGSLYKNMEEWSKALPYYEKALDIYEKILPANHPTLATCYNNIGAVYDYIGNYLKALPYLEKALNIFQKCYPPNHPSLAASYNNIGTVYNAKKEYSKALSYYEKAHDIYEKSLPANHLSLAISFNNIGAVYVTMKEYSKAFPYYEKALDIRQKVLHSNDPDLAEYYKNFAGLYYYMGEYSKALSYFELARDIWQSSLPPNHTELKNMEESIDIVKKKL
ncbi:unnamed protein product [Adineta steineri]|uniref:NAD(P)(+)--arginine ADP-ribosyltransferase n=1 Tax=Adineta steineri TaxID=433720 RepID=A0A819Q5V0_9BILA|nr:unnamed protein product [Adineta steineri]CAF4026092.1 unnamed protein product [Adineta steineri]